MSAAVTQVSKVCRRISTQRALRIHVPVEKRAARRWLRHEGRRLLDDAPVRYRFAGYLS